MTKQKLIALILVFTLFTLSACALVEPDPTQEGTPLSFSDDYLVGLFGYVFKYGETGFPTENFDDENAWYMYQHSYFMPGSTFPTSSTQLQGYFFVTSWVITNFGAAPNGKTQIEANFYYTYEMLDDYYFRLNGVYKKQEDGSYYAQPETIVNLSNINTSIEIKQNLSASRTDAGGEIEEITYEGKFKLNFVLLNYLTGARALQFDAAHNLIATNEIDLLQAAGDCQIDTLPNCEYVVIEEDFEVKHQFDFSVTPIGTKYTTRTVLDKIPQDSRSHKLIVPEGNGLVKLLYTVINFV